MNVDFADVRTVMQSGGSALMGTGIGRGENRAMEAAQQAISSPLLDNVSISGATGVLVNITGGADLTLGEVHQINEIVHDAVGDDAEIIFGAVHEPAMQGEIRVTVIATGFDRVVTGTASSQPEAQKNTSQTPVIPFPNQRPLRTTFPQPRPARATETGARRSRSLVNAAVAAGEGAGSQRHGDPDLHPETDGLKKPTPRAVTTVVAVALLRGHSPWICRSPGSTLRGLSTIDSLESRRRPDTLAADERHPRIPARRSASSSRAAA